MSNLNHPEISSPALQEKSVAHNQEVLMSDTRELIYQGHTMICLVEYLMEGTIHFLIKQEDNLSCWERYLNLQNLKLEDHRWNFLKDSKEIYTFLLEMLTTQDAKFEIFSQYCLLIISIKTSSAFHLDLTLEFPKKRADEDCRLEILESEIKTLKNKINSLEKEISKKIIKCKVFSLDTGTWTCDFSTWTDFPGAQGDIYLYINQTYKWELIVNGLMYYTSCSKVKFRLIIQNRESKTISYLPGEFGFTRFINASGYYEGFVEADLFKVTESDIYTIKLQVFSPCGQSYGFTWYGEGFGSTCLIVE